MAEKVHPVVYGTIGIVSFLVDMICGAMFIALPLPDHEARFYIFVALWSSVSFGFLSLLASFSRSLFARYWQFLHAIFAIGCTASFLVGTIRSPCKVPLILIGMLHLSRNAAAQCIGVLQLLSGIDVLLARTSTKKTD